LKKAVNEPLPTASSAWPRGESLVVKMISAGPKDSALESHVAIEDFAGEEKDGLFAAFVVADDDADLPAAALSPDSDEPASAESMDNRS
jgi:hypothetical protein